LETVVSPIDRTDIAAVTWALALASVASPMGALDALVMSTALTAIGAEFAASIEALEWTISAYMLLFAVFASGLGDRFGRRRVFAWGLPSTARAALQAGQAGLRLRRPRCA
jgi:MFS family permease